MIGLLLLFVGALLVFGGLIAATWGIFALVLHLAFAGLIGWLADAVVPGKLPFGWLGAVTAGLLGSWFGRILLGDFGPTILGFNVIPAIIGAIVLAFVATLFFGRNERHRY
jgi:uncharacterized membrane protein YeaQ/YmgE (transglycosylase-associated protein family)